MPRKYIHSATSNAEYLDVGTPVSRPKIACDIRNCIIERYWMRAVDCAAYVCSRCDLPMSDKDEILDGAFDGLLGAIDTFDPSKGNESSWMVNPMYQHAFKKAHQIMKRRIIESSVYRLLDTGEYAEIEIADEHGQDHEDATLSRVALKLDDVILMLKHEHQEVIVLRYYRQLSDEQIANQLGIPLGTVKSWLRAAMKALHAHLASDAGMDSGSRR